MNPLRVLPQGDEDKAKRILNLWKGASLLNNALTEAADMLQSRDMVVMEDLGEDALPATTTNLNQSLNERHSQVGADAASKLLASMRSPTSELAAFVVVDLSPPRRGLRQGGGEHDPGLPGTGALRRFPRG